MIAKWRDRERERMKGLGYNDYNAHCTLTIYLIHAVIVMYEGSMAGWLEIAQ